MLQAGRKGGRFGKWMGACWFWRAPKIMGVRPHKMGARRALILREHSVAAPTPPGEHELRLPHSPCVSKSPPPHVQRGGVGEVCSQLGA